MCKPEKVLSQQTEIKDNFKNLTLWGFINLPAKGRQNRTGDSERILTVTSTQ